MAPFLTLQFIAPLLAGIFSIGMGWAVLRVEKRNVTYQYFFAIMAAVAVWSLLVALFHIPQVIHGTWTSLHWVAGIFISPAYLLFLVTFPSTIHTVKPLIRFLIWGGAGLMAAALLLWPENFVQYTVVEINKIPQLSVGPYVWLLEAYFPAYFIPGFFFAGRKLLKAYGRARADILTGLFGLSIATIGAVTTNVTLAVHFGKEFIWLGPIFAAIAPASLAYMLFGLREGRSRLFPVFALGGIVLSALIYRVFVSATVEDFIFNGIIFAGTILLTLLFVRTSLIESADARKFADLSRRLQRANENLKRADRVKTEFLAIVSHHLRTPLTHIKWALSELAAGSYGPELAPEQQKLTKDLLANNERLVRFIESFMDTSRIEAGKLVLDKKNVNLESMIEELVEAVRGHAEHYYLVEIEIMPSTEKIPLVAVDEESIKRVFGSILDNAVVYNKPGGKVYVKIEKSNGNVVVAITDTGIGIAKEDLRQVGQKFFRSSSAKRHAAEGTGLGVFIAKHIVRLHGGELQIDSQESKGTTVTVTLPINAVSESKSK